jgi:hypothetical protein
MVAWVVAYTLEEDEDPPGDRLESMSSIAATATYFEVPIMPRYMVERTFPDGLKLPTDAQGAKAASSVVQNNAREGVTWVHSYVTPDRKKTFCIYDGPSPEAIRTVATANGLPVDRISEVRVLDPYFLY